MAQKDWKRFRSPTYDWAGIIQWDADGGNSKVSVSKWDYSKKPKDWQVQVISSEQARKGYPNSKVGITKADALKRAKLYMRRHIK